MVRSPPSPLEDGAPEEGFSYEDGTSVPNHEAFRPAMCVLGAPPRASGPSEQVKTACETPVVLPVLLSRGKKNLRGSHVNSFGPAPSARTCVSSTVGSVLTMAKGKSG